MNFAMRSRILLGSLLLLIPSLDSKAMASRPLHFEDFRCVASSTNLFREGMGHCPGYRLDWNVGSNHGEECTPCTYDAWVTVTNTATGSTYWHDSYVGTVDCEGRESISAKSPCTGGAWMLILLHCSECYDVDAEGATH